MPVRITDKDENVNYLIPAPFVNINKTFDKQGDGEILGSRYSIQLKGWLVADRGSPKGDGTFIEDGVDIIDGNTDVEGGGGIAAGKTGWYEALQNKQKALSNLISKIQAGAYLEIMPLDAAVTGFAAHVRLESVDLPTHNPGDPYKAEYTINLSADYIEGPQQEAGPTADEDDWSTKNKWLISAASENWTIQESDKFVLERKSGSDKDELKNSKKAFELTRTISATGKNKFKRNDRADGLESATTGDGFTQIYDKNGKAWQQARGYIYDIVKYGHQFLFGRNDEEYTGALPINDATLSDDPDDYHLFAMNLPVPNNTEDADDEYKAFNYKRSQTADAKGGSFSITETWLLMPSSAIVTETMEFTTQEDPSTGKVSVTINGSIEGLVDNADNVGVGEAENKDKDPERQEPVDEVFNYDGENSSSNSKYQNALDHYAQVIVGLHSTAKNIINDLSGYKQLSVSPIPTSKTSTQQPGNGIITYSVSFDTTSGFGNFIPYVRTEEFSVSDTYPGQVYAEHVVLGRKLGPVLQDIGTQTHWLREVSLSCNVDVDRKYLCVDVNDEILPMDEEGECLGANCTDSTITTQGTCEDGGGTWNQIHQWIVNPNHINLGTSNPLELIEGSLRQGVYHTNDIITAKPGSAPEWLTDEEGKDIESPRNADGVIADDFSIFDNSSPDFSVRKNYAKRKQYVAIKKLLNSLDPLTYLHEDFDGRLEQGQHVSKRFTNAPQESWNPKTGAWSYSLSWVYEIDDPYTTAASSWFKHGGNPDRGAFDDGRYLPDKQRLVPGVDPSTLVAGIPELPRSAPGQNF